MAGPLLKTYQLTSGGTIGGSASCHISEKHPIVTRSSTVEANHGVTGRREDTTDICKEFATNVEMGEVETHECYALHTQTFTTVYPVRGREA